MKKFLYFADGNGANLTTEAYCVEGKKFLGCVPISTIGTKAFFGDANVDGQLDFISFSHDNTTNTTGHRCKDIGKAIAEAVNAGPHVNGITDVVDLDTNNTLDLSFVTGITIARNSAEQPS
jgi:hypothetical protein|tara:strand:- start:43 stop:405 length:363 start_codon:yes stop_codon:yes gene_type:complete